MLGVALAQLVDVCLVDRDGLLYRLVQRSPLVVSTHEAVIRCERITLPHGLDDGGDHPIRPPVGNGHASHDLRSQAAQTDRHDGLRIRQQREGLRVLRRGKPASC